MKKDTCCGIFFKLTKEERIEAIEMLIKNFNGYDEVILIVSELDLYLNRPSVNVLKKDDKDKDEIKVFVEDEVKCNIGQDTSSEKVAEANFTHSDYDCVDTNIKRVHKDSFSCEICKKICGSEWELKIHKRFHAGLKQYNINSFIIKEYNETVNERKKKEGSNRKKHFICNFCDKPCVSKSDMERHRRVHTGEKPFTCPVCPKTYHRNSDLNWHRKSVHKEEIETGTKKFIHCEKCDKLLITNKGIYENHMKRFHDDENETKMFSCKKCNKNFVTKGRLYAHRKRVHEENCHFICDICSKGWGSKADLERHRRVHTGEKLFPCGKCEKQLGSKSRYEYHMKRYHV